MHDAAGVPKTWDENWDQTLAQLSAIDRQHTHESAHGDVVERPNPVSHRSSPDTAEFTGADTA